jgi:hypothetical protein
MDSTNIIEQAAISLTDRTVKKPAASEMVAALLDSEKAAKKTKPAATFDQFIGNWRLCFVSGKPKNKNAKKSGQYLPSLINIQLSYSADLLDGLENPENDGFTPGTIQNIVQVASVKFTIRGPAKFLNQKNLLAFDFTRMKVQLFGVKLYDGYIRKGETSEAKFYQRQIRQQAFFAYFLITEKAIAARGRGGGLALWARQ